MGNNDVADREELKLRLEGFIMTSSRLQRSLPAKGKC